MYQVGTAIEFTAQHIMPGVEGPEGELHEHDYRLDVVVEREKLDDRGMVCDLDVLDAALARIDAVVRDKNLEVIRPADADAVTVEVFARWAHDTLAADLAGTGGRDAGRAGVGVAAGLRRLQRPPGLTADAAGADRLPGDARVAGAADRRAPVPPAHGRGRGAADAVVEFISAATFRNPLRRPAGSCSSTATAWSVAPWARCRVAPIGRRGRRILHQPPGGVGQGRVRTGVAAPVRPGALPALRPAHRGQRRARPGRGRRPTGWPPSGCAWSSPGAISPWTIGDPTPRPAPRSAHRPAQCRQLVAEQGRARAARRGRHAPRRRRHAPPRRTRRRRCRLHPTGAGAAGGARTWPGGSSSTDPSHAGGGRRLLRQRRRLRPAELRRDVRDGLGEALAAGLPTVGWRSGNLPTW